MSDFERRAGELLRQGSEQLDGHTRSRLTQARFAAVQASRRPDSYQALRNWMPLGGVAAAVLAFIPPFTVMQWFLDLQLALVGTVLLAASVVLDRARRPAWSKA